MKKIASLIVFIALLVWTWSLINGARSGRAETHAGIQDRMRELIAFTIKEKRPTAEGLEIHKLWTESLNDRQIQVHFSYKFLDKSESGEIVETSVDGNAELDKQGSENTEIEQWALVNVKINNDQLDFQEGIIITPSKPLEIQPTQATTTELSTEAASTSANQHENNNPSNKQVAPAATGTNK